MARKYFCDWCQEEMPHALVPNMRLPMREKAGHIVLTFDTTLDLCLKCLLRAAASLVTDEAKKVTT